MKMSDFKSNMNKKKKILIKEKLTVQREIKDEVSDENEEEEEETERQVGRVYVLISQSMPGRCSYWPSAAGKHSAARIIT